MKVICEECSWHGLATELLSAPNPFDPTEAVSGCPKCMSINTAAEACDEDGCWAESCCGTPTPGGYRRTCGRHMPRPEKEGER